MESTSPTAQQPLPPWPFYEVAICLAIAYGVVPLLSTGLILTFFPQIQEETLFFLEQLGSFFTWIVIFMILQKRYHCPMPVYLGLNHHIRGWQLTKYALLAIMGIFAVIALMILISYFGPVNEKSPYEDLTPEKIEAIRFFALATAPIVEEIVFRGFIQSTLYKYFRPVGTILLTALIFAMLHTTYYGTPMAIVYVISLGLLFSTIRHFSGSVIPGMIGHLFNNFLVNFFI